MHMLLENHYHLNPLQKVINICWNWASKNRLIKKAYKIEGDTKGETRSRVLSKNELNKLFKNISDNQFNKFVRFAYYTGARSSEIRRMSKENVFNEYITRIR